MRNGRFNTTQWTLLRQISQGSGDESTLALEVVCEQYWPPLYTYARGKGYSVDDAKDIVQSFFLGLIEAGSLELADEQKGKLRTYLLTLLNRHMSSEWRKFYAGKRGGGTAPVSFDEVDAESWFTQSERVESFEDQFDYHWALTILNRSMNELRNVYEARGTLGRFEALKGYLEWNDQVSDREEYSEAAKALSMTNGAVKVAVFRLRNHFREILIGKVKLTLDDGAEHDANEELVYLMRALASVEVA